MLSNGKSIYFLCFFINLQHVKLDRVNCTESEAEEEGCDSLKETNMA